jgi:hypothetical protein
MTSTGKQQGVSVCGTTKYYCDAANKLWTRAKPSVVGSGCSVDVLYAMHTALKCDESTFASTPAACGVDALDAPIRLQEETVTNEYVVLHHRNPNADERVLPDELPATLRCIQGNGATYDPKDTVALGDITLSTWELQL